jgi:hypothetical protein
MYLLSVCFQLFHLIFGIVLVVHTLSGVIGLLALSLFFVRITKEI